MHAHMHSRQERKNLLYKSSRTAIPRAAKMKWMAEQLEVPYTGFSCLFFSPTAVCSVTKR